MRDQNQRERLSGMRTSPSGRVPLWVLDEAAGRPAVVEPWRGWAPAEQAVAKRVRRNWTGVGGALTVVAIVALGSLAAHLGLAVPGAADASIQASYPHPTPGRESSDAPLGTPMASVVTGAPVPLTT